MSNILIAPSILSSDFTKLAEELQAITSAGADLLHLDIMDGHYVPNLTFGFCLIEAIRKVSSLPLDAHLMVTNPSDYIDRLAALGITYCSFHPETVFHPHRLVIQIKDQGLKAGLAINPGIPVSSVSDLLSELDFVLLMSVNPGYSGQSFIPHVLDKVSQLKSEIRSRHLSVQIEVDGGINQTNAPALIRAGADILVSASYIFSAADYSQAIRNLKHV